MQNVLSWNVSECWALSWSCSLDAKQAEMTSGQNRYANVGWIDYIALHLQLHHFCAQYFRAKHCTRNVVQLGAKCFKRALCHIKIKSLSFFWWKTTSFLCKLASLWIVTYSQRSLLFAFCCGKHNFIIRQYILLWWLK